MRVLILTSSGGTAHDSAAYALRSWLEKWDSNNVVHVEHLLENSGPVMRSSVNLYNWIQKFFPWLHQIYWRLVELEDLIKLGTVIFGRSYYVKIVKRFKPDLIISTHPHINRGHFNLAKKINKNDLRTITCCTELDGGFGFSRNWVSCKADRFWALTNEVAIEVSKRGYNSRNIFLAGPLFDPEFTTELINNTNDLASKTDLPILILGSGANGSNNHLKLLENLLPLAGRIKVIALCGRRISTKKLLEHWKEQNPSLSLQVLGFQSPGQMAAIYKKAWAMVARPGARTATEALAAECVLIFNTFGTAMPQELLARRYFSARGLDVNFNKSFELFKIIQTWLNYPSEYSQLKQKYKSNQLKTNLDEIKNLIYEY